jgi:hypothetical protein
MISRHTGTSSILDGGGALEYVSAFVAAISKVGCEYFRRRIDFLGNSGSGLLLYCTFDVGSCSKSTYKQEIFIVVDF